jgi:hypothetical protein
MQDNDNMKKIKTGSTFVKRKSIKKGSVTSSPKKDSPKKKTKSNRVIIGNNDNNIN